MRLYGKLTKTHDGGMFVPPQTMFVLDKKRSDHLPKSIQELGQNFEGERALNLHNLIHAGLNGHQPVGKKPYKEPEIEEGEDLLIVISTYRRGKEE